MKKLFVLLILLSCCTVAYAVDLYYTMSAYYILSYYANGDVSASVQNEDGKLIIKLKESFLDWAGKDCPERMKQATIYTLSLPEGMSYPATGEEVKPTVTVDASAYGPGAWMIEYGLLTIGEPVYTNNVQAGTATVSVDFVVEFDKTYTLTKTFTITGGAAPERLPGDADNSDGVGLNDAIAILEYLISGSGINLANADVNGDGTVDAQDVLRILQYDAGWDVTLK